VDNVLVFVKHDERLEEVLKSLVSAGITLYYVNFFKSELKFLGHTVNQHGVQALLDNLEL